MKSSKSDILSVIQAAEMLQISPRAVQHRIKAGKLRATKLGDGATSAYVIERTEIERALAAERPVGAA